MTHTFKPDTQGHIFIDNKSGTIKPGDIVYISGNPKDVLISNLIGTKEARIIVANVPKKTLIIGDPTWSGGGFSYGLMFKSCNYITILETTRDSFKISGSKTDKKDSNGFGVQGAYFNLRIDELSDNFIVRDIAIENGGTGVWAKTEVTNDSRTWHATNTYLNNFEFYNLKIKNTYVEGMYIGHTGTYWNIKKNIPYYPANANDVPKDTATDVYKQPIKLKNVIIKGCFVSGTGQDAIQTSAVENLDVANNEVTNWAVNKNSSHNGGILVGGRVKGFKVSNNHVHDGWGEMIQVFAEGGAEAIIDNNLLERNNGEAVSIRGTNGLAVTFTNNTVVAPGGTTFRVNGYFGGNGKNIVRNNILVQPTGVGGVIYPNRYIYLENGGAASDEDNKKFATVNDFKSVENTLSAYGYKVPKPVEEPPISEIPIIEKVTIESNELAALLKVIPAGSYSLSFESGGIKKKITITVE